MKREKLDALLWGYSSALWVMVINEKNGGKPTMANRRSGRLMTGRYCGKYAKTLRDLVKRCRRTDRCDYRLGILLSNLKTQVSWLEAGQLTREPEGQLRGCINLPHDEKIRQCESALDYLDEYFAGVDTDGQMPNHVGQGCSPLDVYPVSA